MLQLSQELLVGQADRKARVVFARRGSHEPHRLYAWYRITPEDPSLLLERSLKNHRGVGEVGARAEPPADHELPDPIENRPGWALH